MNVVASLLIVKRHHDPSCTLIGSEWASPAHGPGVSALNSVRSALFTAELQWRKTSCFTKAACCSLAVWACSMPVALPYWVVVCAGRDRRMHHIQLAVCWTPTPKEKCLPEPLQRCVRQGSTGGLRRPGGCPLNGTALFPGCPFWGSAFEG